VERAEESSQREPCADCRAGVQGGCGRYARVTHIQIVGIAQSAGSTRGLLRPLRPRYRPDARTRGVERGEIGQVESQIDRGIRSGTDRYRAQVGELSAAGR